MPAIMLAISALSLIMPEDYEFVKIPQSEIARIGGFGMGTTPSGKDILRYTDIAFLLECVCERQWASYSLRSTSDVSKDSYKVSGEALKNGTIGRQFDGILHEMMYYLSFLEGDSYDLPMPLNTNDIQTQIVYLDRPSTKDYDLLTRATLKAGRPMMLPSGFASDIMRQGDAIHGSQIATIYKAMKADVFSLANAAVWNTGYTTDRNDTEYYSSWINGFRLNGATYEPIFKPSPDPVHRHYFSSAPGAPAKYSYKVERSFTKTAQTFNPNGYDEYLTGDHETLMEELVGEDDEAVIVFHNDATDLIIEDIAAFGVYNYSYRQYIEEQDISSTVSTSAVVIMRFDAGDYDRAGNTVLFKNKVADAFHYGIRHCESPQTAEFIDGLIDFPEYPPSPSSSLNRNNNTASRRWECALDTIIMFVRVRFHARLLY